MNSLEEAARPSLIYTNIQKESSQARLQLIDKSRIAEIRIINSNPVQIIRKREELFKPIKIIGNTNFPSILRTDCSKVWTRVQQSNKQNIYKHDLQAKHEEDPGISLNDNSQPETKQITQKENGVIEVHLDLNRPQSQKQEDLKSQSESSQPQHLCNKGNTAGDSKLAVRSDVVNKTLLRSLKRYYTSEFEKVVKCNLHGKLPNKDEIFDKLRKFTVEIYQNDARFTLPEFSSVTMNDLIFYMGV